MSGERPDEFAIIERYFAPLAGEGAFGLRDDAALLRQSHYPVVITQDAHAEGVHFFSQDAPDLVARKAVRVNLSDLAAKGAVPTAISIALGLPDNWEESWIAEFARGLGEDCHRYRISMTGGDTFRSPGGTVIAITALGEIRTGEYRSRLCADDGDCLFVTGTIGDGALGLLARRAILGLEDAPEGLSQSQLETLQSSYLLPNPPVHFAEVVAEFASASMDISDGLAGDLEKLAVASGFDAEVNIDNVPLSEEVAALASDPALLSAALTGGDDYQILFTVPPGNVGRMRNAAAKTGIEVREVAEIHSGSGKVTFLDKDGEVMRLGSKSWNHFA